MALYRSSNSQARVSNKGVYRPKLSGHSKAWPAGYAINDNSQIATPDKVIDRKAVATFIGAKISMLDPPCFNYKPLRTFLEGDVDELSSVHRPYTHGLGRCLFDRIVFSRMSSSDEGGGTERRASVSSDATLFGPHAMIECKERHMLTPADVSQKLGAVSDSLQRTVFFFTDITPLYAIALSKNRGIDSWVISLRRFLQCHVSGEIDFVLLEMHHPSADLHHLRHIGPCNKFDVEFHFSYVALRPARAGPDRRGVRAHISMIKPLDADNSTAQDLICYDAQISLLVTGNSDTNWDAYCCVDTWFDSEQDVEIYLDKGQDGPSGGARDTSDPCLNPREYFLLVLSQRFRQTGMEWGNLLTVLMARCDSYERHYLQNIDTADLFDDSAMSRTRSYSKAASMLRRYHDTLSDTLDRLEAFLKENEFTFRPDSSSFQDRCGCYHKTIGLESKHLKRWRSRLYHRMLRFDSMRDGLLNSSVLRESRRSTTQGHDIGVLTYVTIAYLPLSLASSIFGISTDIPSTVMWLYWLAASLCLGTVTFLFAFGRKGKVRMWIQRLWSRQGL